MDAWVKSGWIQARPTTRLRSRSTPKHPFRSRRRSKAELSQPLEDRHLRSRVYDQAGAKRPCCTNGILWRLIQSPSVESPSPKPSHGISPSYSANLAAVLRGLGGKELTAENAED